MEQQEQQQQQQHRQDSSSEETGALRTRGRLSYNLSSNIAATLSVVIIDCSKCNENVNGPNADVTATATATTGSHIFSVSDCDIASGSAPDHSLNAETVLKEQDEEEGPPPAATLPKNSLYIGKQQLQDMDQKQRQQHQRQHPTLMVLEDEEEEEDVAFQLRGRKTHRGNNNHSTTVVINLGDVDSNGIDNSNNSKIANAAHGNSKDMSKDEGASLHNSIYYDQEQDIGTKPGNMEISEIKFNTQNSLTEKVDRENGKILVNEGFSSSSLTPCIESSREKDVESNIIDNEARLVGDFDVIEEIDQEGAKFDVEKVLEKQNTHDLYCPNCNSCITRRVILCRRKRKVRSARHKPRHVKFGTDIPSHLGSTSATNDQDHDTDNTVLSTSLAHDDDNHGGGLDAFTCLSCFSIFIPKGNGFRLFRCFGGSIENENGQNCHRIPQSNTNWFLSMFTMDKRKGDAHANLHQKGVESTSSPNMECLKDEKSPAEIDLKFNLTVGTETQVDKIVPISPIPSPPAKSICVDINDMGSSSKMAGRETTSSSTEGQKQFENLSNALAIRSDLTIKNSNQGGDALHSPIVDSFQHENGIHDSPTPLVVDIVVDSGKAVENPSLGPHPGGTDSLEALTLVQSKIDVGKINDADVGDDHSTHNGQASNMQGRPLPTELSSEGRSTKMLSVNAIKDVLFCWIQRISMLENGKPEVKDKAFDLIKDKNKGNGVMPVEAGELQHESSQSSQNVSVSVDGRSLLESGNQAYSDEESSVGVSIDVLKSIVYGGLIESITSLGVVSSAAGAGATTLEILALGLANVIGGLFIIVHNVIDLKNDRPREAFSSMNEQVDRYQEMLGRRENLLLHMTVVIISYLVFGLLPPVIYGFSFRASSNKDLKLAAAGGASLACIILLAIGKACTQRQPKSYIRTVLYYVIIGLMASGPSFVVGDLISKLLQKVALLESSSALTMLTESTKPARAYF